MPGRASLPLVNHPAPRRSLTDRQALWTLIHSQSSPSRPCVERPPATADRLARWVGTVPPFSNPTLMARSLEARTVIPLATHRCGTCFFFQEAGFAGNVWCLHADRAKSADVRTLVRRNELACRNNWGQSLWTDPKAAAETGAARKLITAQAERPATEGEIGFMVNPRDGQAEPRARADRTVRPNDDDLAGEDVVVGQITVMPPGMTGRRRLVDQVPVELPPREVFRAGVPSEEVVDTAAPSEPLLPRPGRAISTPLDREPVNHGLIGRDRNRLQPVLPGSSDRAGQDARQLSDDRRELADPMSRDDQSPRRRDRVAPTPQRVSRQNQNEARVPMAESPSDRSTSPRPVLAPTEESPRGIDGRSEIALDRPERTRPAPIPGPVPSRELRGERPHEPRPVLPTSPQQLPDQRSVQPDESVEGRGPSRPMSSPILDESGTLSVGPPARSQPARRPALPDLSDDFFTAEVLTPAPSGSGVSDESPGSVRREQRSARGPMSDPNQAPGVPEHRSGRTRPAVPRLGSQPNRQPAAERPIATVAEANRSDWVTPTARPVPPPRIATAPRPDTGWAAPRSGAGEPIHVGTQRPVMATDASVHHDDDRVPARIEPPTLLRPQPADFGEYGGWFDLQSVEPRLAPDLPRACETCRDFRPSENGERGWCANRDAFTLRTVVNATDLPCISSFGCWWVPFDDSWLSEAGIRSHRNPTPLLDQTIGPEENLPPAARQRRHSQ